MLKDNNIPVTPALNVFCLEIPLHFERVHSAGYTFARALDQDEIQGHQLRKIFNLGGTRAVPPCVGKFCILQAEYALFGPF